MQKTIVITALSVISASVIFFGCTQKSTASDAPIADSTTALKQYSGFESQVKWGEHLVSVSGCNDCHTPKKMGAHGPENDSSLLLSGHPAQMPLPDVDLKAIESKGLVVTNLETAWIGPWGVTYSANLTSDSTGIGNWKEDQFIKALREDKWMGLDNTRPILPPMPWEDFRLMTDGELKAIFAYLKSTKPIHNVAPMAQPPMGKKG